MRVTLLGHASVLVEMERMIVLMDPVLEDPFEDGVVVSCPKRQIDFERLPPIDVIILSHRHPDHFDLPSLCRLSRNCQVCCPEDPLITHALRRLGFEHVSLLEPGRPMKLEANEILPTRSENQAVRECGVVFQDPTGVFWNQVDTEVAPNTIMSVLQRYSRVDLLFAMYASQNFAFFESLEKSFPYETHRKNLENVLMIQPTLTVPGSAGFRFFGEHEWLNGFLFPVSRELFLSDLKRLSPTLGVANLNPGDVVELEKEEVRIRKAQSSYSRTLEDDTYHIRFDPTGEVPPLKDSNRDEYGVGEMEAKISDFIEREFFDYCLKQSENPLDAAGRYRACKAIYGLEVLFPHCTRNWTVDFTSDWVSLEREKKPDACVVHRITASALYGWILRQKSFFYVRAYSRRFTTYHRVYGDEAQVHVMPVLLPDLLMHYLIYAARDSSSAALRRIEYEIMQLKQRESP